MSDVIIRKAENGYVVESNGVVVVIEENAGELGELNATRQMLYTVMDQLGIGNSRKSDHIEIRLVDHEGESLDQF